MSVVLVDINKEGLVTAESTIKEIPGVGEVLSMTVDVSKVDEVVSLREKVLDEFGEVGLLRLATYAHILRRFRQWR